MDITIQQYVDWCHANNLWPCSAKSVFAYDAYKKALSTVGVVK